MKNKFTIFYSWQSDKIKNKNFIYSNLDRAIRQLKAKAKGGENTFNVELNLDRDTQDQSGSPAITQTIFNKIAESDIFICDVSLINNTLVNRLSKSRLTPNPNVLIELGYAVHVLGWERIILVNNSSFGENELLPFDLRGHRISTFEGVKESQKEILTSTFKRAIKSIVLDYGKIVERHNSEGYNNQDKFIFEKIINLASEGRVKDIIDTVTNSLFYNNLHYEDLKSLREFYADSLNHFINKNVDESFIKLINSIEKFIDLCFEHLTYERNSGKSISDLEDEGIEITDELKRETLQHERYFYPKYPVGTQSLNDYHENLSKTKKEFYAIADEIFKNYSGFISMYKKEILSQ
ncbi:hypothetical protein [Flavobacterium ovatum]|uniref:hypothetical protein n=1 Tax=Flavobacterium ovatum TaxID=1928857 RepID=UPI00344C0D56